MLPTCATAPYLSRFCEEVWLSWPALHEDSTTGLRSRAPIVAARRARFTVVDLQGCCRTPQLGDTTRAQRIGTHRCSAGGNVFQLGSTPADEEGDRRRGDACARVCRSTTSSPLPRPVRRGPSRSSTAISPPR